MTVRGRRYGVLKIATRGRVAVVIDKTVLRLMCIHPFFSSLDFGTTTASKQLRPANQQSANTDTNTRQRRIKGGRSGVQNPPESENNQLPPWFNVLLTDWQ